MLAIGPHPFRVLALCALATLAIAQDSAPEQDASAGLVPASFSERQLEQIAAPVALYPDPLLAQMLMAATYPVEVAQAARWIEESPGLEGDALNAALRSQDWDDSVKSLCNAPRLLALLNGNLDWTEDLGDAFLGQPQELFAAIQGLRVKAHSAGTLASSDQQTVSLGRDAIYIQPVGDGRLWIPFTSPPVAYGSDWDDSDWPYSDWYQPWDDGWDTGWGWGWGECDWHDGDIDVDTSQKESFAEKVKDFLEDRPRPDPRDAQQRQVPPTWQHDPVHRRGVNYRDPAVAQRYADRLPDIGVSRDEARGRGSRPTRPGPLPGSLPLQPWNAPDPRPVRPAPQPRPALPHRPPTAISGSRSPRLDRAGSRRGARSRGARPAPRPSRPPRPPRGRR